MNFTKRLQRKKGGKMFEINTKNKFPLLQNTNGWELNFKTEEMEWKENVLLDLQ